MSSERTLERAMADARSGRLDAAIAAVRTLLRVQPRNADALQMLGLFLTQGGQREQAVTQLERAVAIAPRVPGYRNNLGNALMAVERHRDAAAQFRAAIEADPAYARAYLGLASSLLALQDSEGAADACRAGLALRPEWPEMAISLVSALESGDRIDEAIAFLRGELERQPAHEQLRSRLLFALNYPAIGADEVAAEHRAYRDMPRRVPAQPPAPVPDPTRAIRIGILSGDLRTHSVGYFAEAIFRGKPADASITCFSTYPRSSGDPMTERLRASSDGWVECSLLDDESLDRAIREQRIDVLVELSGHSRRGRLAALDRKPAPVVVTAIGYPNTTGHPCVDVRLVDSITDPPGSDRLSAERLVRLDPCFLCYRPPDDAPQPRMPAPAEPVTFGSFNLATKVGPETLALWSRVLAAVPQSRLLVKSLRVGDPVMRERLLGRIEAAGIDASRVDLVPYAATVREHLSLYGRVHVALDTVPYNGTTTTCEALWMGVPVVALEGDRHAARVGTSLLCAAGLPELVAPDAAGFVRIAAGLAADRTRLEDLRANLRERLRASALLDERSYGARFHAAMRAEWARWCAGTGAAARVSAPPAQP